MKTNRQMSSGQFFEHFHNPTLKNPQGMLLDSFFNNRGTNLGSRNHAKMDHRTCRQVAQYQKQNWGNFPEDPVKVHVILFEGVGWLASVWVLKNTMVPSIP